jgi:5'-phosphate synthase pdxT subunit
LKKIGVLAVQGDFAEHIQALSKLEIETEEVRLPEHLSDLDGLIIPGGESTSQTRLMEIYGLNTPVIENVGNGMPVWGTCAGMILLAGKLVEPHPVPLGLMDTKIQRNAYGRQVDSFEADISVPCLSGGDFRAIFIRAPKVVCVGSGVEALSWSAGGDIFAVRQGHMLATSFHPELTNDLRFHEYFVHMVDSS